MRQVKQNPHGSIQRSHKVGSLRKRDVFLELAELVGTPVREKIQELAEKVSFSELIHFHSDTFPP